MDSVQKIAAAVLYEGYVLWPYRRSAVKNQKRWTLGGVYPSSYSDLQAGFDPCFVQTECLVAGVQPVLDVKVRFLHVVERNVGRKNAHGTLDFVDELQVGNELYLAWQEATEREVTINGLNLAELNVGRSISIRIPDGSEEEPLTAPGGREVGTLVRSWCALAGALDVSAEPIHAGLLKATVRIRNSTPWSGDNRESALKQAFVSAHAILHVEDGEFISLMDPPGELKQSAEKCENVKLWPVLAGEEGDRRTMLAAPIILYDYPKIAPESPGDLFDGTEIDQLLIMNILTLTDEEKAEMRATDPRTREILERSESLTTDDFMRLHGAIRDFRELRTEDHQLPSLVDELDTPGPQSVAVRGGAEIRSGSKVRLRPRPGGDIMDIALAGQVAHVEAIEQDYDGRIHLAVTVESDPGSDLGRERQIGHRFFFSPDEVELVEEMNPREP
ncbi:MAG: hypothetical protein ACXVCO_05290 [Ktedonobacterales bacterium]